MAGATLKGAVHILNTLLRYLVVVLVAIPVSFIATCDLYVFALPLDNDEWLAVPLGVLFLLFIVGVTAWATRTGTLREDAARAFKALMVVGLLTPVPILILRIVFSGPVKIDAVDDGWLWGYVVVALIVGVIAAGIGYAGYRSLHPRD